MASLTINVFEQLHISELSAGADIRGFTPGFIEDTFREEAEEVFLILLTINESSLSSPIRVVNNNENITSNGNIFIGYPFDIQLPDSFQDAPPRAKLTIDNVSREIGTAIRLISGAPTVQIDIIMASAPDVIEKRLTPFTLRNVKWDSARVTGDLVLEYMETEPFPAGQFSPAYFPGLFY